MAGWMVVVARVEGEGDAAVLLVAARERYEGIVALWRGDGCEVLAKGSMGQWVEHPLVKMMREHEALIVKLEDAVLRRRHRGPEPVGLVTRGIGVSPAAKRRLKVAE